jgi:DNA-binding NarL/FixJ family response regulator
MQTGLIKILIADDHELLRTGCRRILGDLSGIEVIGEAVNGFDLLNQMEVNIPDIVLTDIKMPLMDGIQATGIITKKHPQVSVIALSYFDYEYYIMEMLDAGAKGYLVKAATKAELVAAIRTVYNGENYFCCHTREKLASMKEGGFFDPRQNKPAIHLTPREKEVLQLVCMEKSNIEISTLLNISVRTVEGFRTSLFAKTNASTIAGLTVFAINYGIYDPGRK